MLFLTNESSHCQQRRDKADMPPAQRGHAPVRLGKLILLCGAPRIGMLPNTLSAPAMQAGVSYGECLRQPCRGQRGWLGRQFGVGAVADVRVTPCRCP
jgi:hypothetical protein